MNLRDLVSSSKPSAPYSQSLEQRESGYLKGFLEYQKRQQEELAAYNQTSQEDINKIKQASRFLVQPAANQNKEVKFTETLTPAEASMSEDKTYKFQSKDVETDSKQYNLKTSNITLSDTSDIYKKLSTSNIESSTESFANLYGDLTTMSLAKEFEKGHGFYENWRTLPIKPEAVIYKSVLVEAAEGGIGTYADSQNNSSYDYYSLAYKNRAVVPAVGQTGSIYNSASYDYKSLLQGSIDSFVNNSSTVFDSGVVYPHAPVNGTYAYQPFKLKDDIWELYSKRPLGAEANLSEVGVYNPDGAWAENGQSLLGKLPLLGDLQQKLSDLEGSSILWQAFYNKKATDPTQIYKLAAVNANIIGMTGRFVPMPPNANDIRFSLDNLPVEISESISGPFKQWAGGIPSYPYMPLPNAVPKYKIFTVPQLVAEPDIWKSIDVSTYMIKSQWEILKDLENRSETSKGVPSFYPSQFGYEQLKDFEGHTTIYDLQIVNPKDNEELPKFEGAAGGTWDGRSLASFTTIAEIPEAEVKTGGTYQLGEFCTFLLSLSYMNYVTSIKTITRETAECDCYKWGKQFIEWMYGQEVPNRYKHRSIYKSYYDIIISKIYYQKSDNSPIVRVIESRTFHGVPTFNLTEQVNDQKLQEFPITWDIIGYEDKIEKVEQTIINNKVLEKKPQVLPSSSNNLPTYAIA